MGETYSMHVCNEKCWLRHHATSRKVAGSSPTEMNFIFSIYLILPASL
jgi:hypothetical protein